MSSNGEFDDLKCSLSNDKHYVYEPISLPCGDCCCKKCLNTEPSDFLTCKTCNKIIERDKVSNDQSNAITQSISRNLESLFEIIYAKLVKSIEKFKS